MGRLLSPIRNERGATLVFFVAMTIPLLSLAALAADAGMMYTVRSEAQRAAEAGALAGANLYKIQIGAGEGPDSSDVAALASEYALEKSGVGNGLADSAKVEVFEVEQRVRVTVYGRANLLFARIFGRLEQPVSAVAAARVTGAGDATCVKPWAIPDMWDERSGSDLDGDDIWDANETWKFDPDVDHYERWEQPEAATMTGYGSDFRDDFVRDQGRLLTIKVTDPKDNNLIEPGLFFPWDLPGGNAGGDDYRDNIATCSDSTITLGREYPLLPGDKKGPTWQGVGDLIAQDDRPASEIWAEIQAGDLSSPRVIKIALFDPEEVSKSGRQSITFNNIALLFIEKQDKMKDPVTARFIKYADGVSSGTGTLVQILQLVE